MSQILLNKKSERERERERDRERESEREKESYVEQQKTFYLNSEADTLEFQKNLKSIFSEV